MVTVQCSFCFIKQLTHYSIKQLTLSYHSYDSDILHKDLKTQYLLFQLVVTTLQSLVSWLLQHIVYLFLPSHLYHSLSLTSPFNI